LDDRLHRKVEQLTELHGQRLTVEEWLGDGKNNGNG
jgi:hypothetical protein